MEAWCHLGVHYLRVRSTATVLFYRNFDNHRAMWRPGSTWACCTCTAGAGKAYTVGDGKRRVLLSCCCSAKRCRQAQGHVEAWFHLGVLHLRGWGTPASPTSALNYFNLAAKMGHLLAQYNLAMMHLSGAAAEKCAFPRTALSCSRKCSSRVTKTGHMLAQCRLAIMHLFSAAAEKSASSGAAFRGQVSTAPVSA